MYQTLPLLALFIVLLLLSRTHRASPHMSSSRADADVDAAIRAAVARTAFTPSGGDRPIVLLTAVNHAFHTYLSNFNCSLSSFSPQPRPLVIAMDGAMQARALRQGFESLHLPLGSFAPGDDGVQMFGSKGFNLLSKQKLYAVYKVLQTGVDVLFSDADVVWCGNAAREVARLMYGTDWSVDAFGKNMPHLLMQTAWPRSLLNSGFYYARSSPELLDAFEAFLAHDADSENDQVIVNRVLCRKPYKGDMVFNGTHSHPAAPHRPMPVLCRWDGRVDARLLPAGRFPTGGEVIEGEKIFHHPRRYITSACRNGEVAVLHNNCILSSKKKARFVAKGMWYLDEDGETCLSEPSPATIAARKGCGGAKCGPEGDVRRYPDLVVR